MVCGSENLLNPILDLNHEQKIKCYLNCAGHFYLFAGISTFEIQSFDKSGNDM